MADQACSGTLISNLAVAETEEAAVALSVSADDLALRQLERLLVFSKTLFFFVAFVFYHKKKMKIIKRVELEQKEYEVKCSRCTSTLSINISDLRCGVSTDYGGDKQSYVGFTCIVCNQWQDTNVVSYEQVDQYTQLKKNNNKQMESLAVAKLSK